MGKTKHTFEKGLSTDFSPLKQPKGTYLNAENIVRDVMGTIKSEAGTALLAQLPVSLTNVEIIGEVTIEDEIIFFVKCTQGSLIVRLSSANILEILLYTSDDTSLEILLDKTVVGTAEDGYDTASLLIPKNSDTNALQVGDTVVITGSADDGTYIIASKSSAGGNWDIFFESIWNATFGESVVVSWTVPDPTLSAIIPNSLAFDAPIQAVARRDFQGNIILYWVDRNNLPRRYDTSETITAANFTEKLTLFTNPTLPRVTDLEVLEGGGLTTGLYKFAARLVTQTGNTTTFSQISQGIPVVNDSKSGGMYQYDGAPPQTAAGKSIKINLENIDTSYNFIEIAAITYLGEENLLSAFVVGKIPITSDTLEFEYYSDGQQLEEVLLAELVAEAIEYTNAESILQKDNHLFLANLEATDLEFVEAAMLTLAAQIKVHYTTRLGIQMNNSFTTSTSGAGGGVWNDTSPSTYEDGDVFATTDLTIDPITESGFQNYKEPDWTYKYKGYQRDEVYSFAIVPIFPGGIHGTAYHIPGDSTPGRISTKENSASETGTRLRSWQNADGTLHHRMPSHAAVPVDLLGVYMTVIGLEFKDIDLAAVGLDTVLEGYTIVRQRRNKPGNGIVVTTGIAKELSTDKGGGLTPIPLLGRCSVARANEGWGDKVKDPTYIDYDIDRTGHFMFYSPDVIHGLIDSSYYSNMQEIKQVDIRGTRRFADNRGNRAFGSAEFIFGAAFRDNGSVRTVPAADTSTLGVSQVLQQSATTHIDSFIATSQRSQTLGNGVNVKSAGMTDVLIMKIENERLNKERNLYTGLPSAGGMASKITVGNITGTRITRYEVAEFNEVVDIYVVYSYPNNVYGDLDSAEYILCKEIYLNDSPGTDINVYGGDTFISSYMFSIGEKGIDADGGRDFRAQAQITLETKGNYDYRHFEAITFEGEEEIEGTMPYAPKYPLLYAFQPTTSAQLGLWNYQTDKGPGSSYNKHYNFENTLNKYYPKDLSFEAVTDFPNRIIYSLESFENEQFDAYRTFLTNNFHDTPKESGAISNIFEYNNILYAHTPHSLWRTFVNEKTFTNTTSGDIVLGNGGLFPMPSEQVYTQTGGFAGSTAKFTSINTPYGRVFVDDHQRKVFMLVGREELKELSDPFMFNYFTNKVLPANSSNYQIGYEPLNKRFILSFGDNTAISYSFELQSWSSFHTYSVDKFTNRDNLLYATSGSKIYELGRGQPNYIFESIHPSKLSLVTNDNTESKEFRNLKWIQRNKSNIFDEVTVRTEDYTTGTIVPSLVTSFADEQNFLPLGQQQVHLVGGEHRMSIPPDNNSSVVYPDESFRPTIKGKYGIVDLTFNPTVAPLEIFELEEFETEYINIAE